MDFLNILTFIGGLAMLLFGIQSLSACLCRFADSRLSNIVDEMTSSSSRGVLWGAGITSVIQSSAVMTVTAVGLTNAGILRLRQAIAVIMGANIGTTLTAWLLSITGIAGDSALIQLFRPATLAALFAVIGVIVLIFVRSERGKTLSSAFLSVAILFWGMMTMTEIVLTFVENGLLTELIVERANPFLCLLVGIMITAILQSSSASIGILQAVSAAGIVPVSMAFPLLLGMEIGACTAAFISSFGGTIDAKRAAASHLLFNVLGAGVALMGFLLIGMFLNPSFYSMPISLVGIAAAHTLFNVVTAMVLMPNISRFERLLCRIVPDKKVMSSDTVILEQRFLFSPAFAAKHSYNAVLEMVSLVYENLIDAVYLLYRYDKEVYYHLLETKSLIDEYEKKLREYLASLSRKELTSRDGDSLAAMLCSVVMLKQMGRHAENIGTISFRYHESGNDGSVADVSSEIYEPFRELMKLIFVGFENPGFDTAAVCRKIEIVGELCDNAKNDCRAGLEKGTLDADTAIAALAVIEEVRQISECCDELSSYITQSDVGLLEK